MRKGCKALLCLAAAVLGLFLVRLAVEKTEPSYPEALGNTLDVEKITGTCQNWRVFRIFKHTVHSKKSLPS